MPSLTKVEHNLIAYAMRDIFHKGIHIDIVNAPLGSIVVVEHTEDYEKDDPERFSLIVPYRRNKLSVRAAGHSFYFEFDDTEYEIPNGTPCTLLVPSQLRPLDAVGQQHIG